MSNHIQESDGTQANTDSVDSGDEGIESMPDVEESEEEKGKVFSSKDEEVPADNPPTYEDTILKVPGFIIVQKQSVEQLRYMDIKRIQESDGTDSVDSGGEGIKIMPDVEELEEEKGKVFSSKDEKVPTDNPPSYEETILKPRLLIGQNQSDAQLRNMNNYSIGKDGNSFVDQHNVSGVSRQFDTMNVSPYQVEWKGINKTSIGQAANVNLKYDNGGIRTHVDPDTMEQAVLDTRHTMVIQQSIFQRLQHIENRIEAQTNQARLQQYEATLRGEQMSQRVVEQLVNNEQFQRMIQHQTQPVAETPDDHASCSPSSYECKRCGCKFRCGCKCHRGVKNEQFKMNRDFERADSRFDVRQLSHERSQTDGEFDWDMSRDFRNNFPDASDVSDHEMLTDGDSKLSERRSTSALNERNWYHAIPEGNVASGGGSGPPPDDDPSSDDGSDDDERGNGNKTCRGERNNRKKKPKWIIDPDAWKMCLEQDFQNEAVILLDDGKLPTQALLNKACQKYNRRHPHIQSICKCICSYIMEKSDTFLDVWAAYQYKKGDTNEVDEIAFVILTIDDDSEPITDFTTYKRKIYDITTNTENDSVKAKENEDPLHSADFQDLEACLKENAKMQMDKHSKLTRVTVSWYKSSGYDTDQHSLIKQPCIALYVHVKGYIPLHEEPFAENIGRYQIDVREGVFVFCGEGPNDFHRNVKMGCAIRGEVVDNQMYAGTLGAFIEFENDINLYAITSAHVLFVGDMLKDILEKGSRRYDQNAGSVYQPVTDDRPFGAPVAAVYREGGNGVPGMEIAVIEVSKDRLPDTGTFPDDPGYQAKGFGPETPLEFNMGNVCDTAQLSERRIVFKYGGITKLTEGVCRVLGASVRTQILKDNVLDYPITLHGQIEIESMSSSSFAEHGDSGALVLTKDGTELSAVGLFEGKMDDIYLVSPISSILGELQRLAGTNIRLKTFESLFPRQMNQAFMKHLAVHKDEIRNEIRQNLEANNNDMREEIKQNLSAHKSEIKNELAAHKNELRGEMDKQKEEIKDHMTAAIQHLLLSLNK